MTYALQIDDWRNSRQLEWSWTVLLGPVWMVFYGFWVHHQSTDRFLCVYVLLIGLVGGAWLMSTTATSIDTVCVIIDEEPEQKAVLNAQLVDVIFCGCCCSLVKSDPVFVLCTFAIMETKKKNETYYIVIMNIDMLWTDEVNISTHADEKTISSFMRKSTLTIRLDVHGVTVHLMTPLPLSWPHR